MHTRWQREANLLGVLALELAGRMAAATAEAVSMGAGAPAAIAALRLYPGCTIDDLRRVVGLSHPGAVRLVDRLQRAGLVERRRGDDARTVALVATAAGEGAAARILDARLTAIGDVLALLDEDGRRALEPLLERLVGGLAGDRPTARRVCRLCDADACGHPQRCPITQALR
jgi:MarR family transcriptional regulator, negative regulator of the multidrug operon emrRAB